MSKIQRVFLKNFKAIDQFEADFKGCTAILTAGNNRGKTSFLKGIPDRIRFIRPSVITKQGTDEGKGELILDSGERFVWEFDKDGKDKLTFFTSDGIKSNFTKEVGQKYFPAVFDIDKFLQSSPTQQAAQLQKIVGIDFTEIDARYLKAYNDRTEKNRDAEKFHAKLSQMQEPEHVSPVDVVALQQKKEVERTRLNDLYRANKAKNEALRTEYTAKKEAASVEYHKALQEKANLEANVAAAKRHLEGLQALGYSGNEVGVFIQGMPAVMEVVDRSLEIAVPEYVQEIPDDSQLQAIEKQLLEAFENNAKAKAYQDFIDYKREVAAAKEIADEADRLVKDIEEERLAMIRSANFPEGIEIRPDGIFVDGFPLDRNQISTSKLYCAALRIASIGLGEVKTLYFDASFLDKNTLSEIHDWAEKQDLQLLIERPDYEGGEIRYELIEG